MHKLIDYICDELEELERKADKDKLTVAELEYADMLAHLKKNLLTAEAMTERESDYSNRNSYDYMYDGGMSNARGRGRNARRDSMGRYSRRNGYDGYSRTDAKEDLMNELQEMQMNADDETKQMLKNWMRQLEQR